MPTLATAVQDATCARLATLGLAGIPVHGLRRGQTWSSIAAALNAVGLAVHVLPTLSRGINGNLPGPWVEGGELIVRVVEDPLLNNTDLTRWDVMEQCIATLEGWKPDIAEVQALEVGANVSEALVQTGLNDSDPVLLQLEVPVTVRGPIMASALPTSLGTVPLEALDTPVLKRGHVDLEPTATSGTVDWDTQYMEVPTVLKAEIVIPTGGDAVVLSITSVTATGFTWSLNTPVPASPAGYLIQWLAQL